LPRWDKNLQLWVSVDGNPDAIAAYGVHLERLDDDTRSATAARTAAAIKNLIKAGAIAQDGTILKASLFAGLGAVEVKTPSSASALPAAGKIAWASSTPAFAAAAAGACTAAIAAEKARLRETLLDLHDLFNSGGPQSVDSFLNDPLAFYESHEADAAARADARAKERNRRDLRQQLIQQLQALDAAEAAVSKSK
jgi:hypothetical protein